MTDSMHGGPDPRESSLFIRRPDDAVVIHTLNCHDSSMGRPCAIWRTAKQTSPTIFSKTSPPSKQVLL